jgi:FkbM family methyltransferase
MTERLVALLRPLHFRGKLRLLDRLVPREGSRRAVVHGCDMELDLADLIQRGIYLGSYEPSETRAFKRILRPGGVVVDVGANVGYFTALAARLVGERGRVFAFEPSPYAFERLSAMVLRNKLRSVVPVRAALDERRGSDMLYLPPESAHNHSPTMASAGGGNAVAVDVRTLDDCLDEWGVSSVDLLKLDVEGFEHRVLRGAARALAAGKVRNVLVEFNDFWLREAGTSGAALYELLERAGFRDAGRAGRARPGPPGPPGRPRISPVVTRWMRREPLRSNGEPQG